MEDTGRLLVTPDPLNRRLSVSGAVVETVFGLSGFGTLAFQAIKARDAGLILATTMLPIFVGLAGNLVQDIAYAVIDPRVEYE